MPESAHKVAIYNRILRFVKIYNRSDSHPIELANTIWIEYEEGGYDRVRLEKLEDYGTDETFMAKFVKLRCLQAMSKTVRRIHREVQSEEIVEWTPSGSRTDEQVEKSEYTEALDTIMRAIEELSDHREAIVARLLAQGRNYREIQVELGVSLGTVTNLVRRLASRPALQNLKKLLSE